MLFTYSNMFNSTAYRSASK